MTQRILRRECARVDRRAGELSLVLFRVKARGDRPCIATCRLAHTILARIRETDEVGWFGRQFLAAVLPDTPPAGATAFAQGVRRLVSHRMPAPFVAVFSYPRTWVKTNELTEGTSQVIHVPAAARRLVIPAVPLASGENGGGRLHDRITSPPANGHALAHANGNGHSHGANGHANGNGHANANGRANGHHHPRLNGEANGNGQAHHNGKSHANGNGHAAAVLLPQLKAAAPSAAPIASTARLPGLSVEALEELLVLPMPRWKRACDIVIAILMLVALTPLMAMVAFAIKISSRGPVIFTQRRAGLGGKPFTIYKFRTMVRNAEHQKATLRPLSEQDGPAFKLSHDPRITWFGQFLRKSSIDELPQLWNVIKGDMSLVGPRPLPLDESDACESWQRRRLDVTPGLTCIWQVEGRSRVTFAEWVRMDVRYIRRRTPWHDLKILLRTVPAVLLRRGAR